MRCGDGTQPSARCTATERDPGERGERCYKGARVKEGWDPGVSLPSEPAKGGVNNRGVKWPMATNEVTDQ